MNQDLIKALAHLELAKRSIERANDVLWLDHTIEEINAMIRNLEDDMSNEARRLNLRVLPIKVVA